VSEEYSPGNENTPPCRAEAASFPSLFSREEKAGSTVPAWPAYVYPSLHDTRWPAWTQELRRLRGGEGTQLRHPYGRTAPFRTPHDWPVPAKWTNEDERGRHASPADIPTSAASAGCRLRCTGAIRDTLQWKGRGILAFRALGRPGRRCSVGRERTPVLCIGIIPPVPSCPPQRGCASRRLYAGPFRPPEPPRGNEFRNAAGSLRPGP